MRPNMPLNPDVADLTVPDVHVYRRVSRPAVSSASPPLPPPPLIISTNAHMARAPCWGESRRCGWRALAAPGLIMRRIWLIGDIATRRVAWPADRVGKGIVGDAR